MPTNRDYYEVLSVSREASVDEIKRAYRKAAMKYHPDRNPGDSEAEMRFKECSEAFEVLTDPEKRQRYDRFGHQGLSGTGMHDFSHMGASDIFSLFEDMFGDMGMGGIFGGRRRGGGNRARRGYDLETVIEIRLEDVLSGTTCSVEFTRQDLCETCHGSGAKPGTEPVTCNTCGGRGQVTVQQAIFQMVRTCPHCQGTGKIIEDKCPDCAGKGQQPKKRALDVKVPAGIHEGQIIRVNGEGEPGTHGGPRGDLHVVVKVVNHTLFKRDGDDLILSMPISFTQAALGAKVQVPTLDGQETLTIPKATQHGQTFVLRNHGLPNLRYQGRGNLVVQVLVEIPKRLSEKQEQLLRDFAETEDHQVMPHSKGFWSKIKEYLGSTD